MTDLNSQASIPDVTIRSRRMIHLGPLRIEIGSNEPRFSGFRFFCEGLRSQGEGPLAAAPHFTVTLCNLNIDGPWPVEHLGSLRDKSYRAGRMAGGYYLTDHFGEPAYLMSRGTDFWLFAQDFTGILWPYVVKYLLTIYSMQHELLHVKAAAVAFNGRGALLVGRGGSGKTVLLTQLCQAGASFLSNTHTLLDGEQIVGVPTAMRVRRDRFFQSIIAARQLAPSVKPGEFIADPRIDLGWTSAESAALKTIFLLDYRGSHTRRIELINSAVMYDYMDQFGLALNVYGLKEDVLDYLNSDIHQFSAATSQMRKQLRASIDHCRCYYISCDAADDHNLETICRLLRSEEPANP